MGIPEETEWDVPNFVKDVPNFVKDVPRVQKCALRWGSTPNHFLMGSKMKLWTIHVHMGVLEAIGLDVPNFLKHVLRWGSVMHYFLMGSQMKLWTLGDLMGVLEAIGWDVPNLIKDVPNFVKNVPDFVNDVLRVQKCVPRWGSTPQSLPYGLQNEIMDQKC